MTKVKKALSLAKAQLAAANLEAPEWEAQLLCAHLLTCTPAQLLWHLEEPLSEQQIQALQQLVDRRSAFYPLQYLLGQQQFMGLDFVVSPAVLIPRWDTECLVEEAIKRFANTQSPLIADICCGSGAIGISIAYYLPQAQVVLCDVSEDALKICRDNMLHYQLTERCCMLAGDLVQPLVDRGDEVDLLIVNPPYIPAGELSRLPPDVQREPRLALDGGKDGLDYYRRLAQEARPVVKDGGQMILEIGCEQKNAVCSLLQAAGWMIIKSLHDLGGRDRGIVASKQ